MTARRLAVFDVDGTLVDSAAMIVAAMTAAFRVEGLAPPPRPEILGIVGLSLPVAMARLLPDADAGLVAALVAAYRQAFSEEAAAGPPPFYPGAREVLEALAGRGDVALGIATGKSRTGLDAVLRGHGVLEMFVSLQVSDDHPSKPHPAMLRAAVSASGVAPRDAVMIGDTRFDVEMAQAAGVPALGVTWGFHPAEDLAAARALVHDCPALLPALDRLWGGT